MSDEASVLKQLSYDLENQVELLDMELETAKERIRELTLEKSEIRNTLEDTQAERDLIQKELSRIYGREITSDGLLEALKAIEKK